MDRELFDKLSVDERFKLTKLTVDIERFNEFGGKVSTFFWLFSFTWIVIDYACVLIAPTISCYVNSSSLVISLVYCSLFCYFIIWLHLFWFGSQYDKIVDKYK